ncbi:triacylglycerol lipase [Paraneptunicella aestuarii]|uniref:triacylglycerol lipase n=1 Tax=Paraneptunicella aestuarii TaxID=2831148 RepID=UPI001E317794|nr:triacylglycerol lipase [Paraneptunicella aestuarii]UAA38310.1 triacylglycerol lipase [Paraneptunicella aestuarii]
MKHCVKLFAVLLMCLASTVNAGTYTQTKYPIVLVHGLFGFDDILGIDYFYGIPQALSKDGAKVFVTSVSAGNSSEVRGEQLLQEVREILAITGAKKVNLIGHSHGSPTSRYVASVAPELVASVTSVGGVNWGSPVADAMRGVIPEGSFSEYIIGAVVNAFTNLIEYLSGHSELPTDTIAALNSLTTQGTIQFNSRYPEGVPSYYCGQGDELAGNGVYYYSWSGADPYTNIFDPVDPFMEITSWIIPGADDGLVSSCSSRLGKVINDHYDMNHLDEVNQTFGITDLWETDPKNVFRSHANRLKNKGL